MPHSLAEQEGVTVSFDTKAKVLAYRTYLAEWNKAGYQGFGIAATSQDVVSNNLILWDKDAITTTPPPDDDTGDDDDDTVLRKTGPDGEPLSDATFLFKQIDGDEEKTFTTTTEGTIVLNWTNPKKKDIYLEPGSYQVTEVKAPTLQQGRPWSSDHPSA